MRRAAWLPSAASLAMLACAAGSGPVRAADDAITVESVGGYDINRVKEPGALNPCRMVRAYEDKSDGKGAAALAFSRIGDLLAVSLVRERWAWGKAASVKARFSVDRTVIDPAAPWLGNDNNLVIKAPMSAVSTLSSGRRLVVGLKGGEAGFDLGGFREAYAAMLRCDAATPAKSAGVGADAAAKPAAKPSVKSTAEIPANPAEPPRLPGAFAEAEAEAAAARAGGQAGDGTAPAAPGEARRATYLWGTILREKIETCDIATTARQRTALDARIAGLKAEMGALEPDLRAAIRGKAEGCPPAQDAAALASALALLVDATPEAFAAEMDRRAAARPAAP